jgi:hypothetical protein
LLVSIVAVVALLLLLRADPPADPAATSAPPADDAVVRAWSLTANQLEPTGDIYQHTCPKGGSLTEKAVVGTGPYGTTSWICVAAVHAGLITVADGGTVTVVFQGPQVVFGTSEQHGVRTVPYIEYPNSFLFRDAAGALVPAPDPRGIPLTWQVDSITPHAPGTKVTFYCPPDGSPGRLLGTDVYSAYSSPCTAAVHAGRITLERGGSITIESRPEQAFKGSERNGVTSADDYPSRAFVVLTPTPSR